MKYTKRRQCTENFNIGNLLFDDELQFLMRQDKCYTLIIWKIQNILNNIIAFILKICAYMDKIFERIY